MDRDNISALVMAIAVVAVIVGFGVYFNSPALNKASSQQQLEKVVSARYYNKRYNQNNKA